MKKKKTDEPCIGNCLPPEPALALQERCVDLLTDLIKANMRPRSDRSNVIYLTNWLRHFCDGREGASGEPIAYHVLDGAMRFCHYSGIPNKIILDWSSSILDGIPKADAEDKKLEEKTKRLFEERVKQCENETDRETLQRTFCEVSELLQKAQGNAL